MANPWEPNWVDLGKLGKGGQGLTHRVHRPDQATEIFVLKKLKNNQDGEARRRMFQEVANLRVLADAGVNVPRVHDGNTERYADATLQLYFIMDYIPGKSLAEEIETRGRLSVDQSIAVTQDLCTAMARAHLNNVWHRDLKPANIIVRNLDQADAVIIDLGLSFNKDKHQDLTTTNETFGNEFLRLPEYESRDPELRRDPRSAVTALVGILYYCLTGHNPIQPRDPSDQAPHRRPGRTIRDYHSTDFRCQMIEQALDRGFMNAIESRFRTVSEFANRLNGIRDSVPGTNVDLSALIDEVDRQFKQFDRPSQLQEMSRHAGPMIQSLMQHLGPKWQQYNQHGRFKLEIGAGRAINLALLQGIDALPSVGQWYVSVTIHPHGHVRVVYYAVGADGPECVLFQSMVTQPFGQRPSNPTPWLEIVRYDPKGPPTAQGIAQIIEKTMADLIQQLANDVRPGTF